MAKVLFLPFIDKQVNKDIRRLCGRHVSGDVCFGDIFSLSIKQFHSHVYMLRKTNDLMIIFR
jgi:hypothetical protein